MSEAPDGLRVVQVAPRRRGRPKASEPCASVSAWVPTREYERLRKLAQAREQSLSSLVRDLLIITRQTR